VPDSNVSSRLIVRQSVDFPEPEGRCDDDLALADRQVDVSQDVQVSEVLVDLVQNHQRPVSRHCHPRICRAFSVGASVMATH